MVDCRPEETLSTEAEPRLTMIFEGWRSTMSSRKECNIYFIIPNVPISYTTSILCYQITLRTGRHFHCMSPVAMTLLRMPRGPPLVSQFEPYAYIFAHVTFFWNVTLPSIALVKTVWHYINMTFFTGWHGRLSPRGNIVDRGGAEVVNAFRGVTIYHVIT